MIDIPPIDDPELRSLLSTYLQDNTQQDHEMLVAQVMAKMGVSRFIAISSISRHFIKLANERS